MANIEELKKVNESFAKLIDASDVEVFNSVRYDLLKIQGLIDAEIAKQSVTDEEVQRAIEFQQEEIDNEKFSWSCLDEESKCEPGTEEMHVDYLHANELAITALRQMQGWIPCSDRVPEVYQHDNGEPMEFMVMIKDAKYPTTLCFNGDEWFQFDEWEETYEVTHWMPLPEPPKGEQS